MYFEILNKIYYSASDLIFLNISLHKINVLLN